MLREHTTEIRVRYSETDAMGYLHHSNYANYCEVGRMELYRADGGDYRGMEEDGLFFVVTQLECNYRRPARYDDLLTVKTRVTRVSHAKLEHEYEITRDGELVANARTVLALVNRAGVVQRITDYLPVD